MSLPLETCSNLCRDFYNCTNDGDLTSKSYMGFGASTNRSFTTSESIPDCHIAKGVQAELREGVWEKINPIVVPSLPINPERPKLPGI